MESLQEDKSPTNREDGSGAKVGFFGKESLSNINGGQVEVNSKLHWALKLASFGFPILLLKPGSKEPLSGHSWTESMTIDQAKIREWLTDSDSNYGVCGGPSGVIIDVDVKHDKAGDNALSEIEKDQDLDECISTSGLIVTTPSGGKHYYLTTPFPVSDSHRFPKGIDVRGAGYTVGPFCQLIAGLCKPTDAPGVYEVQNDETPLEAPAWVVERLKPQGEKDKRKNEPVFDLDSSTAIARATDWIRLRAPAIQGQEGDKHTLLTAMGLIDLGLSEEKTLEIMTTPLIQKDGKTISWNDLCEPPWDYNQLAIKVANAWRYREERPGVKGTGLMEMSDAEYGEAPPKGTSPAEGEDIYVAYMESELDKIPDPSWLIQDHLPEHALTMTYGATGSLKTFLELDAALCGAAGIPWAASPIRNLAGFKISRSLRVAIMAGEGARGLKRRLHAWKARHRITATLSVLIIPELPAFKIKSNMEKIIRTIKARLGGADLVIVDTAMLASSGLDLNQPAESQTFIDRCRLIGRELGCTVTFVHHTGKDRSKGHLGAENLMAAVDMARCVKLKQSSVGRRIIEVTYESPIGKMKDAEAPATIQFEATLETAGTDDGGRPIRSLVLDRLHFNPQTATGSMTATRLANARQIVAETSPRRPLGTKELAYMMAKLEVRPEGAEDMSDGEWEKAAKPLIKFLNDEASHRLADIADKDKAKGERSPRQWREKIRVQ